MERKGAKLGYLDGLRGLASLIVVLHHFTLAFLPAVVFGGENLGRVGGAVHNTPAFLLVAGQFAVCVFFVLSGFVLSYKFFVTERADVVTSGAVRRYFRLMPLVLVAVLLSYAAMKLGWYQNFVVAPITGSSWLIESWSGAADLLRAVKLALYDAFVTGRQEPIMQYNNVLWTMRLEFWGSLLVFGVLAVFGRLKRRWIVYLVLAVLLARTYYLAFILGLALCDWVVARQKAGQPLGSAWIGGAALAQGLSLGGLSMASPRVLVVAAGLVVTGVVMSPWLRRALAVAPIRYLGRVSFAVYLVHLTVLVSLGCAVFLVTHERLGQVGAAGLALAVSLPVVLGLAELLTRWVDEPAIRLSGVIYRRLFAGERGGQKNEAGVGMHGVAAPPQGVAMPPSVVTEPDASVKIAA